MSYQMLFGQRLREQAERRNAVRMQRESQIINVPPPIEELDPVNPPIAEIESDSLKRGRDEDNDSDAGEPLSKKADMDLLSPQRKIQQIVKIIDNHIRPVIYRMTPKSLVMAKCKMEKERRMKVMRSIFRQVVPQFQKEAYEETSLEGVQMLKVAHVIDEYSDEARLFSFNSGDFKDEFVAVAVEYGNSVKMLHFGRTLKKHSGKLKREKFQTWWWEKDKKKITSGLFPKESTPFLEAQHDPVLFEFHGMFPLYTPSNLQKVIFRLKHRLNLRRTTDEIIRDSAYFVREFFLLKAIITLRVTQCVDVPECYVPPTLECGYFPASATTVADKMHYITNRFKEAQEEYLSLTYRSIAPKEGYSVSQITADELYEFHATGRHIHGFFLVWELDGEGVEDFDGTRRKRRYLVDMFHFMMFPLYMPFERWQNRMKTAFDRTTVYLLHLTEIIRINRPVFDCLAQNDSLFKPICLQEMCEITLAQEVLPSCMLNSVGQHKFYKTARENSNAEFLSAFLIINGASKVINDDLEPAPGRRMFPIVNPEKAILVEGHQFYAVESTTRQIRKFFLRENFNSNKEVIRSVLPRPPGRFSVTRQIIDPLKTATPTKKAEQVRQRRSEHQQLNRMDLVDVRKKLFHWEAEPKQRKEPELRKRPGRKRIPVAEKFLKKHDFTGPVYPSDIESEPDYYVSDEEDMVERTAPTLKRTTSSESFHIPHRYYAYPLEGLSLLHKQIFPMPRARRTVKRTAKLRRILQKHVLKYRMNRANEYAIFQRQIELTTELPNMKREIAKTKLAIRVKNFPKVNLPLSFEGLKAKDVDDCRDVVLELLKDVAVFEKADLRMKHRLGRCTQMIIDTRRSALAALPKQSDVALPRPSFLALEWLCNRRIANRHDVDTAMYGLMMDLWKNMTILNLTAPPILKHRKERATIRRLLNDAFGYFAFDRKRRQRLQNILEIPELPRNPNRMEEWKKKKNLMRCLEEGEMPRIAREKMQRKRERRLRKAADDVEVRRRMAEKKKMVQVEVEELE